MPRQAFLALAVVVAAVVGVGGLVAVLASRDDSTVEPAGGPGVARPAGATPRVSDGNVVLLHADERLTRRLRELAADIAGPPDSSLVAAGQAVLVRHQPDLGAPIVAVSATRRLDARDPGDPELRAFVEYWLGREAPR
ncbi:MAG TPA: hypothetical protein VM299_00320 [Solirubrobacteraceae bacterium]|jgi:hypothetical protein|nr:hypothetical protein [Solirubrobacteraceae bacterium]